MSSIRFTFQAVLRRRRVRLLAIALAMLAATVSACLGANAATTSYNSIGMAFVEGPQGIDAPRWSRPCWRPNKPQFRYAYTRPCARVVGRVVLRQAVDPDGDGDAHLVLLAGAHLVNLKVPHHDQTGDTLPGVGATVRAVGIVIQGHLPLIHEVEAEWWRPRGGDG